MNCSIGILGSTGVGKTSICFRYVFKSFSNEYIPTIASTFNKPIIHNDHFISLDIHDLAGDEGPLTDYSDVIQKSIGFLLVFDLTQESSLLSLIELKDRILDQKGVNNVPMILVGNKLDLDRNRAVSNETAISFARRYGLSYCEVSAKHGIGVENVFESLLDSIHLSEEVVVTRKAGCFKCLSV